MQLQGQCNILIYLDRQTDRQIEISHVGFLTDFIEHIKETTGQNKYH